MDTADKHTLAILGKIAIVALVIIAGFFACHKCANGQTYKADSITITIPYSAQVDEWMTQRHGTNMWPAIIKGEWREAWKNRKSEAKEAYKLRMTDMFDFDGASGLTKADQGVLLQLKAKQDVWKEQQRLADSAAAAIKPVGEVVGAKPVIYANVGKAYSPRLEFLDGLIAPPPAEAPTSAPPSGLPFNESAVITYIYVVHALAIVGLVAIGIWAIP